MNNLRIGKLLGGAAATALLLSGANIAFAQTYSNGDGTGSIIPSGSSASDTGTGQSTNTTGTSDTSSTTGSSDTTGSVQGASTTDPNVPNTGAGGDLAMTLGVLGASGIAALGGALYLARQRFSVR